MSVTEIPDLWPADIKVDIVEPVAILRAQEGPFSRRTQGLLRTEVRSHEIPDDEQPELSMVTHSLDLIAPSLHQYRVTLLTAKHRVGSCYPVLIQSQALARHPGKDGVDVASSQSAMDKGFWEHKYALGTFLAFDTEFRRALTQDEFIGYLREILQSGFVRSLIDSLIAQSNSVAATENGSASESQTN